MPSFGRYILHGGAIGAALRRRYGRGRELYEITPEGRVEGARHP